MEWVRFTCCNGLVLKREVRTPGVGVGLFSIKQQSLGGDPIKTMSYYVSLESSIFYKIIRPWLTEAEYAKRRKRARRRCLWMCSSTVQGRDTMLLLFFFFFFFSLISLAADGPHHYHPACGHKGSSHLSPVHALHFFIAMKVQHSYNSSTNG